MNPFIAAHCQLAPIIWCLILFNVVSLHCYSQEPGTNELRNMVHDESLSDSLRAAAAHQLASKTYYFSNFDSAAYYAELGLELLGDNLDVAKQIGALQLLSSIYIRLGSFEDAGHLLEQAEGLLTSDINPETAGKLYLTLGSYYQKTGSFGKAHEYIIQALKKYEQAGIKVGIAQAFHALAISYIEQADMGSNTPQRKQELLDKAKEYTLKVLDLHVEIGDGTGARNAHNNLAIINRLQGNLNEALGHCKMSLTIADSLKNDNFRAHAHNNLAVIYQDLAMDPSDSMAHFENMARFHYYEGLRLREEMGDIPFMLNSLNNIALLEAQLGNHAEAVRINRQALDKAYTIGDIKQIRNITQATYLSEKALGNFEAALDMHIRYVQARDSINNESTKEAMLKQELEYSFEKEKLEEQARYETAVQEQKNLRNLSFAGGVMLLLVAFVFFNRFRLKQKAAKALEIKNVEVEAARERAERSEAFRKQFLANMSHEIRTPMNAILGMTRLLKDREHDPQSQRYLDAVDHAANNLLVVINDILDLSKLEAGKMEARLHPAPLREELRMLATTFAHRASEKGLEFSLHSPDDLPHHVHTDMARVNQVLYNLLGNAIKFTERGNITLSVKHEKLDGDKVLLSFAVSDTGPGIAPEEQAHIFESFGQGHGQDNRRFGGTGLGLTIAQSMVEMLGGKLKLDSALGEGATFSFNIPCTLSTAEAYQDYHARHSFHLSERHRSYPLRILLADDNEYNRLVAVDTLRKYMPQVHIDSAQSGHEVLAMLPQMDYDLVFMDVQMPGMDGYAATEAMRNHSDERIRNMHIIAFTASVIRTDIQRCYDAGMNGYIAKPFRDDDLLKPLAALIDKLPNRNTPEPLVGVDANEHAHNGVDEHSFGAYTAAPLRQGLFLKLVPGRLEKLTKAIDAGDADTAKQMIHLMRAQLLDAGMNTYSDVFDWFEHLNALEPDFSWKRKAEELAQAIKKELELQSLNEEDEQR